MFALLTLPAWTKEQKITGEKQANEGALIYVPGFQTIHQSAQGSPLLLNERCIRRGELMGLPFSSSTGLPFSSVSYSAFMASFAIFSKSALLEEKAPPMPHMLPDSSRSSY